MTFDYTITDGDGDTSRATVTIALLADSTPTISVAGDNTVNEAALPARGEEPAGSNAASPDETAVGTIPVTTGGDTLASLTINGTNVTTGGTVTTAKGVLTVTRGEGGAYSYSYTLADNTLADPDSDTFSVVVTDSDGDTASTSLVIAIADDTPTARDDSGSVAAGTYGPISGSVTANDTPGADGIVVQSYARGEITANAGAVLQGQYGKLTIAANGSYSYTRDAGTPGGVSDSFAYTVRDGDGDLATANLVITIADSGTTLTIPVSGTPGSTQVLEAGLPAGSAAAGNGEFASGTFNFAAPDGPATVSVGGTVVTTVGQTIAGSFGTLTITSIANGAIGYTYQLTTNTNGDATSDAFAVTVMDQDNDSSTGTLTIAIVDDTATARADIDSAAEDGPLVADGNVITASGGTDANATDGVADTRGADGASVSAVSFGNVAGTVGGATAGTFGSLTLNADGSYSYTLNNANPLVQGLDKTQTLTETFAYTLRDGDGDTSPSTLTITILGTDDGVTLTGLNVEGGEKTVFEANLADGSAPNAGALTQTGSFTTAGIDGIAAITVGGLTVFSGGTVTTGQTFNAAFGTLTITSVTPVTDAAGDTVSATIGYSYTLNDNTLAHGAAGNDSIFDSFAVTVTDTDGSSATDSLDVRVVDDLPTARADADSVTEDGPLVADGNVITGSGGTDANATDGVADTRGADGASVSAVSFGNTSGTVGSALAGTYGSLTLNADGSYSYALNNANPLVQGLDKTQTLTETFAYTLRDGDGDTSPSTLTITIVGADDGVTITGLNVEGGEQTVNEANLGDGSSPNAGALTKTGSFTVDGQDGIAAIVVGGKTVFTGGAFVPGQTIDNGHAILTITAVTPVKDAAGDTVSATVSYSYVLTDNTLAHTGASDASLTDSYAVSVTDTDGSAASASLDVNVLDDVPTARADADSVSEDGPLVADGNVVTGNGGTDVNASDGVADTRGADGASVTAVSFGNTAGTVGTALAGAYGALTLNGDGSYSYALNNANPLVQGLDDGETLTETYSYTLTDGDGDARTTTLTITVTGTNDAPVVGTGTATVSEEGLGGANVDAVGDTDTTDSASFGGQISISDADGEASIVTLGNPGAVLTSGGTTVTWSGVGTGTLTGSAGDTPVIRIAIDNFGAYTVTLLGPVDQAIADVEDVKTFTVPVNVSDGTVSVPTTLTVTIEDDSPLAANDTDAVTEDGPISASGNVLTGVGSDGNAAGADSIGADGPAAGGAVVALAGGTVGSPLAGSYGSLTLNATGGYTYTLDNAALAVQGLDTGETLTETFTYTIRDRDGDTATATLTVTINGTNDAPVVGTGTATVSEEGLKGANVDAVGNTDTTDSASFSSTISITDADGEPSTVTLGDPGAVLTSGGATVTWSGIGTGTLTGSANGGDVIRVTIDNTGSYTVTLLGPVDQATANVEDVKTFVVPVSVSDGTATVPTTLTVTIEDDSPLAANDTDAVTEDGPTSATGNVLTGVGSDGNAAGADSIGADGPAAGGAVTAIAGGTVGSALAGTYGSLTLNADGSYTYALNNTDARVQGLDGNDTLSETFTYTISDRDGDTATATLLVTINGANDPVTITGLNVEGGEETVFEANLADGSSPLAGALTQTGTFSVAAIDGITSIVVGGATVFTGGAFVPGQAMNAAFGTLTITSVTPVTDANGDTVSATIAYSYKLNDNTLTHPAAGADSIFDSFAVSVTDSDGSTATDSLDVKVVDDTPTTNPDTNMVDEGATTTGNVLTDGTDDVFGADGRATTVPAGGVVAVNGGAPGTPIVTALGTLTLNSDGSYTYVAKPNTITVDTTDSFTYTIRDADGDISTTTLTISLKAVNGMVADNDVDVDEAGLPVIGSAAAGNGEFDTDGQITVTGATGPFTYTLISSPLTPFGTLSLNSTTGAYSYTLTRPFDNATVNDGAVKINGVEGYGYRVTDQFGNVIGTGTIAVNVIDDIPTARADTAITVAEDGANVGGNLLANDTQGADGATVTSVRIGATTTAVPAVGTVTITTATGQYTFQADGTWTFNPDADQSNDTVPVSAGFTYTITDGDGDQSSAAQVINIVDGANPMAGDPITLTVDDQNLANGSTPAALPPVTASGTIAFVQGSDSIATIVFDTDVSTLTAGNLTWMRVSGTQIVGKDAGSGLTVVTLDLVRSGNSATITATLSNNFDAHPALGDDLAPLGFVNVVATDGDGDFVKTAVNVQVSDDVPTARDDTATQAAENAAFTIDALFNDTRGADGVNTADAAKVFVVTNATYGVVSYSTATGLFTYTPNAGAGSDGNLTDSFTYRIVDGDGDISTATVSITLQPDSAPMVKTTTNLSVDEDGFPAHNPDGGTLLHPTETAGSNSLTDLTGSAVVNFGNDVPSGLLASIVLVDLPAYDTQLTTLSGQPVVFAIESGALVGRETNAMGVEVIRIAITGATTGPLAGDVTYTYSTTLAQPVRHTATGEDSVTLTGVTFRVTDSDSDTTTGSFNVAILDDVPSIDVTKGTETGVLLTTQDAETIGALTDTAVSTARFGSVFALTSVAGSDGTATAPALAYTLAVTNMASGLTSGGVAITLAMSGATVVGSAGGTPVFSIAVAGDGTVTLSQFQQIDHPIAGDPNTTDTTFDDHLAILGDGRISLTASATITDRDGDTVSDSETIDLGGNIRFADDGPVLTNVAAGAAVSVDETAAGVNFASPVTMTSATAAITATSAFGADGMAASGATIYGLTIVGNGATTLQTAVTNQAITLVQTDASTIVGQYGASLTAFTLSINANGTTTLTQNVALEHNMDGNTAADYNDTLTLAGLVNATITIKDFDGDTATASAAIGGNVSFLDDGVDARNDSDTIAAGVGGSAAGNLLTGVGTNEGAANADYRGADGSFVTSVSGAMGATSIAGVGSTVVQGSFGVLTISADGTYSYARTPGAGGGSNDVFTYTLTDNDGDFDTATLTINIGDLLPVATTASATVDDEGLMGGILGIAANGDLDANVGDAGPNTSEAIFSGTLGGTLGDGTNTFAFTATQPLLAQTIGQETVTYAITGGGSILTATIATSPTGRTGVLFTAQITDTATGAYTLTLSQPVLHLTLNGLAFDDTENDAGVALGYQLTDADLDVSTAGVLTVTFDDDIPTATAFAVTQATENAAITIDLTGRFAAGADGLATITATNGTQGTVSVSGTMLTYTPASGAGSTGTSDSFTYTITDKDGDSVTQTVSVTLQPDSTPTVTVTDVSVNEKGLAKGTGELADQFDADPLVFNANSDTSETATGSFTITTGGDTLTKVEVQGTMGFVDVTNGGTVTGAQGTLTVTVAAGVYSYSYTLNQNVVHTVQGAGDTVPGDSFAVRVTDSDGDATSATPLAAATINVTVVDDAPVIYAAPAPLTIINATNPAPSTANFDFAVGADQRTSYSAANSDFTLPVLTGTVGGNAILSPTVTFVSESATQATFNISFMYTAGANTFTETGTLVFDKVGGSYTVDLASRIEAAVTPPSVAGSSSIIGYEPGTTTPDSTQPFVSVAAITPQLFVQFTGFNGTIVSGPGPNPAQLQYTAGETLSGDTAFVSISGSANGVAGDTMGKGEVLDFDFFTADPKGILTTAPDARVTSFFVKLDGIGNNEDFIVILKLLDTTTMTLTTKAVLVENGDLFKSGTVSQAGDFSGISLDNNDALLVIDKFDYNLAGENFVIVGTQITATDEGITGTAIDLVRAVGMAGASTATQNLSGDGNDTGFKISNIGFITTTTVLQNATLNFAVQVKDSEGDLSAVQNLMVGVSNTATPVVLDLNGNGVEFVGTSAGLTYDYSGNGTPVATAWAGRGDGVLAIDLDGNGVANGAEIVFGGAGLSDLGGLAARYDTNDDGTLDANDASFAQFGVVVDGEFETLAEAGIASIGLVSDGKAYTAADGEVTVSGSATYTRADGSTGTVADASFATAALDKLEAKTAELTAANAAAAGVLAAAAAVAALPVAAAEVAPAAATDDGLPASDAVQTVSGSHEALRSVTDDLASPEAAKAAPAETASHGDEAQASASNLAEPADHAAPAALADSGDAAGASPVTAAAADFGGAGGQLMEALLAAAQAAKGGVAEAGQSAQDLAAVQEAFGDSHGAALVDAMVDHFAGAQTALAAGGEDALAALMAANVGGGESYGPAFDLNQMLSDMSAHAAAQV